MHWRCIEYWVYFSILQFYEFTLKWKSVKKIFRGLSCCKFCIDIFSVNSKFTTWRGCPNPHNTSPFASHFWIRHFTCMHIHWQRLNYKYNVTEVAYKTQPLIKTFVFSITCKGTFFHNSAFQDKIHNTFPLTEFGSSSFAEDLIFRIFLRVWNCYCHFSVWLMPQSWIKPPNVYGL